MEPSTAYIVSFSPTGTTRKILVGITNGFNAATVEAVNLTPPAEGRPTTHLGGDGLAIIGAPVYGGRLPAEAISRLRTVRGDNTPAVVVVVYGNRDFEDALLELKDLAVEQGFVPVAGAAFIGEHSFSTRELPIAVGRPDGQDLDRAAALGQAVRGKLAGLASLSAIGPLPIPGRFPYEGGARAMNVAPVTNEERCTLCGVCAGVCPTAAIVVAEQVTTEVARCIRCCACIKSCPEDARLWEDPMMLKISTWLAENCAARKEPQLFGVSV